MTTIDHSEPLDICPECNGSILTSGSRGEITCHSCGLVLSENELDFSERKMYDFNEIRNKKQNGMDISDSISNSLNTTFYINETYDKRYYRLRRVERYFKFTCQERALIKIKRKIDVIAERINIPKHIKKSTFSLIRRAKELNLTKGRSIDSIVICCLYYNLIHNKMFIRLKRLCELLNTNYIKTKRIYIHLFRELKLKNPDVSLVDYCRYILNDFDISIEFKQQIIELAERIPKTFVLCKNPICIVGALICIKANSSITQKQIASTLDISEASIRGIFREIKKAMKF